MQPSINRSGRTVGAGFMLALSWLAWGCGGEGSAREGHSVSEPGVQGSGTAPPPPLASGTCDRTATNAATLASQWSAATAGQTICLATGSYGTFAAGTKPGVVTVKPQSGATATLAVRFNGANNVRLEGLTITSAALLGSTRDVTITGSRFTGAATIDGVANSNILFDGNTHLDINAPTGSTPARIHLPYSSSTHSGVTIQNSRFEGGDADGIQTGVAVNILNNQFKDILENGPNHTDSIQLLGAPGAVVRGNYFLNCATGIVAYDGVERAVIEDNVLDLRGRPWAIELYSDDGSIVRHNTLQYGACDWNLPCGIIDITRKTADDVGRGTVIVDNVATEISVSNGSTVAERHHNLLRRDAQSGELTGAPVFVGGANPTDRSGFRLATGSPGKGAASDGTDVGIR